jgi:hypothetical protein
VGKTLSESQIYLITLIVMIIKISFLDNESAESANQRESVILTGEQL